MRENDDRFSDNSLEYDGFGVKAWTTINFKFGSTGNLTSHNRFNDSKN